ncbi:MAG TPA: hypothetical protein VD993_00250 [Chitinophagaceae bacterium]|nr:hypothetical protein [Chitinophagaceae bacterium]
MAIINKLILLTILCNLCIIVGVGHGAGPLGIVEFMYLGEFLSGERVFNFSGSYADRLPVCAVAALFGQLVLLGACFWRGAVKTGLVYTGLAILLFSFIYLIIDFRASSLDSFSLLLGVPFLYASVRLVVCLLTVRRRERLTWMK